MTMPISQIGLYSDRQQEFFAFYSILSVTIRVEWQMCHIVSGRTLTTMQQVEVKLFKLIYKKNVC